MTNDGVKLLDMWASPFGLRARIALGEKGVAYESQEEDLFGGGKSDLLLSSNPIYQKVPVLLHDGKPIVESANIVAYIDEVWPKPSLMPACAYGKARARFWAHYIDDKVFAGGREIWLSKGEELEVAKKEMIGIIKVLEGALGDNDYFGGESFGYVDVLTISLASWFPAYEKYGGFKVEDHSPKISAWIKKCMERDSVARVIPDAEKICGCVSLIRKMNGIEDE